MKHYLFVCTGNTCRSPMAESLFRKLAAEQGYEAEARSAGVSAYGGSPMSGHSATVLKKKGIADGHAFQSSELTQKLVEWADLILTMTSQHKRYVLEGYPDAVEKTFTLKEYAAASPETDALHKERESLIAGLQMKKALNQPFTEEERTRLTELEQALPELDIEDPIGGPIHAYEAVAEGLEKAIKLIIAKEKEQAQ